MSCIKYFLLTAVAVCLISCKSGNEGKKILCESKGLPSELLLVVDKDVWETDLKDSIDNIVKGQVAGLMQAEDMFRVTRIFTNSYDRMYSTMHSKLFVHVDPKLKKPMMGINRDVSARPQIEVTVAAPSLDELRGYLHRNGQKIQDIIEDAQLDMRVRGLNRKYSKKVSDDLQKVMGMTIRMPETMCATKKRNKFLWGGTNLNTKDLNVVVYQYPWKGNGAFDVDEFVRVRDSVMMKNIPGEREGQWMQTTREKNVPLVFARVRNIGGRDMLEVRGLWEMRNGALGGPFVSLVRVDSTAHRVIVSEGFVYSPDTDKRDLLRQVEAGLRTLKY